MSSAAGLGASLARTATSLKGILQCAPHALRRDGSGVRKFSGIRRGIMNKDVRMARRRSAGGETRVRDVSYAEIQRIRAREVAFMQQPQSSQALVPIRKSWTWDAQSDGNASDSQSRALVPVGKSRTQDAQPGRNASDSQSSGRRSQYAEDRVYDDRRRRRRESTPGYGDGERDSRSRVSREQDLRGSNQEQQRQRQRKSEPQDTSEASQERRVFDHTSDGIISAAAGAALGAITARYFASKRSFAAEAEEGRTPARDKVARNWTTIGGAVLGAAAVNMAEAQIQNYFLEEKREQMEHMQTGGELAGEMVAAVGPDVL